VAEVRLNVARFPCSASYRIMAL